MRKLLSIALIAAMIISVTPLIGIGNVGSVYAETIPIDEEHFPDANFRNYLTEKYGSCFDPTGVISLDVSNLSIESLEGIQYFTDLDLLDCSGNGGTNGMFDLDVSQNTALVSLLCAGSGLTNLDISHNTALEYLDCQNNKLENLDVSKNNALSTLYCRQNNLKSLDVSHNTVLEDLSCDENNLSSLDVSHNTVLTALTCSENNLSILDVSNNTALEHLFCAKNNLRILDVSNNTALKYLYCSENNLRSLDVSHNPALVYLYCRENNLDELYVGDKLPEECYYDDGVEIIYGSGGDDSVQRIDYKKDTWSFENPLKGGVSYKIYKDMLRDSSGAWLAWKVHGECDDGLCYGMAQTVLASYLGYPNVEYYYNPGDTSHPVSKLNQVERGAYNYDIDTSAIDLIRHAFVYQFSSNSKKSTSKKDDLDGLYEAATNFQNNGKEPVAITITWGTSRNIKQHALAVLGGAEKCEYGYRIKVYDCNFPGENVYIYLYGTPGHFTKWWESYGGGKEVHASDDSHNTHIQYLSVTDDIISKFEKVYGQSIKSSSTRSANDEDGILIALDVSSQGVLNYNGESVRIEEIYESELENISPVIVASDNEAEEQLPVLCWLFGDDKKVTVTGMAENDEVSVVGNGAVITAKSSNTGDICIDASDNSVLINGEKGAGFIASYEYVGEETVKTVEATGVIESTVEIVPENDEVNVTGASGVQINETTIDLPSEDDPCANGHTWNTTYTVDVPATESAPGSKSIHCSICGAIKEGSSVEIPQLTPSTPTPTPAPSVTSAPQAPAEIQDLPAVKISKPAAAKKSVNVKWKKVSKKNQKKIQGIEIQVATDPDFTNLVKTATAGKKKTSKKIKGLTSKQTYYVRIRAYKDAADGRHVSAWKDKKVKIK